MKGPELSPRLAALAAQVPPGARLADVGTDHAYLPVALLAEGRIAWAAATDVHRGPLERAAETARRWGVADRVDLRLGDGLDVLAPGEADTVVLAGMGGALMAQLIDRAPWTRAALLLLQPMSTQPELRAYLTTHGYRIERETVVPEGARRYTILTVRGGTDAPYAPAELLAGRQRPGDRDPHRAALLDDLIRRQERALAGMAAGVSPDPAALDAARAAIDGLCTMREEWSTWQR